MALSTETAQHIHGTLKEAGIEIPEPLRGESPYQTAERFTYYVGDPDRKIHELFLQMQAQERIRLGFGMGLKEALGRISDEDVVRLIFKTHNFVLDDTIKLLNRESTFPFSSLLFETIAASLEEGRCLRVIALGDKRLPRLQAQYKREIAVLSSEIRKSGKSRTDESRISTKKSALQRQKTEAGLLPTRWATFLAAVVNIFPNSFYEDVNSNPLAAKVNTDAHRALWQECGFSPSHPVNGMAWEAPGQIRVPTTPVIRERLPE